MCVSVFFLSWGHFTKYIWFFICIYEKYILNYLYNIFLMTILSLSTFVLFFWVLKNLYKVDLHTNDLILHNVYFMFHYLQWNFKCFNRYFNCPKFTFIYFSFNFILLSYYHNLYIALKHKWSLPSQPLLTMWVCRLPFSYNLFPWTKLIRIFEIAAQSTFCPQSFEDFPLWKLTLSHEK